MLTNPATSSLPPAASAPSDGLLGLHCTRCPQPQPRHRLQRQGLRHPQSESETISAAQRRDHPQQTRLSLRLQEDWFRRLASQGFQDEGEFWV